LAGDDIFRRRMEKTLAGVREKGGKERKMRCAAPRKREMGGSSSAKLAAGGEKR